MVCSAKRMPSLRPERETGERREMLALRQIFVLSRLTSFVLPRLCAFAEQSTLPLLTHGGWKPVPQRSYSQRLWLEEKDGQIHGRSRWFVHNAG